MLPFVGVTRLKGCKPLLPLCLEMRLVPVLDSLAMSSNEVIWQKRLFWLLVAVAAVIVLVYLA